MPFWAVVRQARSGIEHVVSLAAATEHKAFSELVDWVHAAGHGGARPHWRERAAELHPADGLDPAMRNSA